MPFANGADEFQSEAQTREKERKSGGGEARRKNRASSVEHRKIEQARGKWGEAATKAENNTQGSNKIEIRLRHFRFAADFHTTTHTHTHTFIFKFNFNFNLMWMWQHFDWFCCCCCCLHLIRFPLICSCWTTVRVYFVCPPLCRQKKNKFQCKESQTDAVRLKLYCIASKYQR